MTKLETVDRVRDAIEAAPTTTMRKNPSRFDGRPWEVISIRQDGNDWPVHVHSDHGTESDAYAAWQRLERQKITRAVAETMREPIFDMVFAGMERLRTISGASIAGAGAGGGVDRHGRRAPSRTAESLSRSARP